MGQMKTKCSSSATGLFFLLLMIVSFSSCTRTQKTSFLLPNMLRI